MTSFQFVDRERGDVGGVCEVRRMMGLTLALAAGVEGSDALLFGVEETWGDNQPRGQ